MKKLKLLGVIVSILLLTGCYNLNISMDIKKDKSMDFNYELEIDLTEYMESMGELATSEDTQIADENTIDEEAKKKLEDQGYTVTINEEGYKTSMVISKHFDSIDEISTDQDTIVDFSELGEGTAPEYFFKKEKGILEDKYIAIFNFNAPSSEDESVAGLENFIKASYKVTLPNKAISSNASDKANDDKELTWNLSLDDDNQITYQFAMANNNYMIIIPIVIAVILLIIVIIVITKISKNKKQKQEEIEEKEVEQIVVEPEAVTVVEEVKEEEKPSGPSLSELFESNSNEKVENKDIDIN